MVRNLKSIFWGSLTINRSAQLLLVVRYRDRLCVKIPVLLCFYSKTHFSGAPIQNRSLKPSFFRHPMQPVREHFCSVFTRHSACKTQPAFAQNTLVRIGAKEAFHQHRESGPLRFFPYRHFQRIVDLRLQRASLAVGQKTVVPHHFKMPRRNMADVTLQHLLLADFLAFVLLRSVIVILMHHGTIAIVAQLRSGHRWALQITAKVFHAAPGAAGLFGEVHFPATPVLCMQVAVPPIFVTDMAQARQGAGIDAGVVVPQQIDDGIVPDGFHCFLFKEQITPGAVFDVEAASGDRHVDMRMLIQLPTIGVQRAKDADFDTLPAGPAEHGAGGAAEQAIEQGPVVVEERPQQVGHGKRDVLPVAVGQDVLLFGDPLLGGLEATTAAGLGLAALTEKAGMGALR